MTKEAAQKVQAITPKPVPGKPSKSKTTAGSIGHNSQLAEGETAKELLNDIANSDQAGLMDLVRDTVLQIEEDEELKKTINKRVRERKQVLKRNGVKIGVINRVLAERKIDPETSKANRQEVNGIMDYLETQETMDFGDEEQPEEVAASPEQEK